MGAEAGAGGARPKPIPVVADCTGLNGVDKFENITPPGVIVDDAHLGVLNVVADQVNSGTVFVGTDKGGIFRSDDCGSTWEKANTGTGSDVVDSGSIWFLLISPDEANTIYWASLYGTDPGMFKSTNGGKDSVALFPKGSLIETTVEYNFFQWASINPENSQQFVASFHADCKGPAGPMCLAETSNGGQDWRVFKGPTPAWEEAAGPVVLSKTNWLFTTFQHGVYITTDSGASWRKPASTDKASGKNSGLYRDAAGTYYIPTAWGIHTTTDGDTWTQIPNSPNVDGIIGDGTRLFSGQRSGDMKFYTAPEVVADGQTRTFTELPKDGVSGGPVALAYDANHHLLYSANLAGGLYRMVTK